MFGRVMIIAVAVLASPGAGMKNSELHAAQQQCLHGPDETPQQQERRKQALGATRKQ